MGLRGLMRWARRGATLVGIALLTILVIRAFDSQRGPPLERWHTFVPEELDAAQLRNADWPRYLAHEDEVFAAVAREVTDQLDPEARVAINRYYAGSPLHPPRLARDWNRSFVLEPDGPPLGAAVLLHGLTDAPFSQRHIAELYRARGWLAVVPRLPGHGTVPAGLTKVKWEDWAAATRLAVREARRRVPEPRPLHLVGYSNGGALAVDHALEALRDPSLGRPDRLVLISPMIGVTAFARFAGLAALPAVFPAFAKAAWLALEPEFNPFKYNSFPVNGARQSYLLTHSLQTRIEQAAGEGRLAGLGPVLTFQSVVDDTVSTPAVISQFYALLPANGSELVLFDLNRSLKFGPLLRANADDALARVLPAPPRAFRTTLVAGVAQDRGALAEDLAASAAEPTVRALGLSWPPEVFSLSHVALPFPLDDGLYGLTPDPADELGVNLGAMALRGERRALAIDPASLLRMQSNPFFPYLAERIDTWIAASGG